MRKVGRNDACPCGSGQKFKQCCLPAHEGAVYPETPEALLRSRYSAYVTGDVIYLYQTTHPENELRKGKTREQFAGENLAYCRAVDFTGLTIKAVQKPLGGAAQILFTATYRSNGESGEFTELSDFTLLDGKWVYRSGIEK